MFLQSKSGSGAQTARRFRRIQMAISAAVAPCWLSRAWRDQVACGLHSGETKNKRFSWGIRIMKRILAAAVALLALMTHLHPATSAGGEADLGQTEPLPPLAEGGVANFTIVRSDLATSEQARPAVLVREALESVTGAKFAIKTDWEKPMPSQQELSSRYEILVGDTNRAESKQAKEKLVGDDEFIIETIGHKLVITANSERR